MKSKQQSFKWAIKPRTTDLLSPFIVAEDVSLTGGAAAQRIRLIDEEEQVCYLKMLQSLLHP